MNDFLTLPRMLQQSPAAQTPVHLCPFGPRLRQDSGGTGAAGRLDLALTRYRYYQRMKMTKEEAKRDYREEEGDP